MLKRIHVHPTTNKYHNYKASYRGREITVTIVEEVKISAAKDIKGSKEFKGHDVVIYDKLGKICNLL